MDVTAARPNPFAIPSGTLVRFVLLIVAASTTAVASLSQNAAMVLGVRRDAVIAYQLCVQQKIGEATARARGPADPSQAAGNVYESIADCHDPRSDVGVWPALIALAFFWLVVLVVYWLLPRWRIRRRRWRPLDTARFADMSRYLLDLQREAGVRQRVGYLLDPLNPKVTGLAFGRVGRRCVVLSGGLAALFERDRQAFRTVVLHELAHVRNRDLDITFVTIIVWRLVVILLVRGLLNASAYVAIGELPAYGVASELASTVQTVLLAVLVPLARAAVLRSRELYADARTATWDSSPAGLAHLFDTYSTRPPRRGPAALRSHPPLRERRIALAGGTNLFTIGFWQMAGVGLAATLAVALIAEFLSHPLNAVSDQIAVLVAAPLLGAAAGTLVWREAIRASVAGTTMTVRRAALGLGTGLALGAVVDPTMAFAFFGTRVSPVGILLPWLLVLFLSGPIIVGWIALVARCWLPVLTSRPNPAPVLALTLLAISLLLAVWLRLVLLLPGLTLYAHTAEYPQVPTTAVFFLVTVVATLGQPDTVLLPLLLGGALVPLVGRAWARRGGPNRGAPWVALDPLPAQWPGPVPRSELGRALVTGVLCACAVTILIRLLPDGGEQAPTLRRLGLGTLAQLAAATITTVRARSLRSLYGIVAAATAGGLVLLVDLRSWPTPDRWQATVAALGWGLLAASAVAVVIAALAAARDGRARHARAPEAAGPLRPGR